MIIIPSTRNVAVSISVLPSLIVGRIERVFGIKSLISYKDPTNVLLVDATKALNRNLMKSTLSMNLKRKSTKFIKILNGFKTRKEVTRFTML